MDVPLPDTYIQFNELVRNFFPVIYDTKHIASKVLPLNGPTSLEALHDLLKKDHPHQVVCSMDLSDQQLHVAGYDAYLTGSIFAFFQFTGKELHHYQNITHMYRSMYYWQFNEAKPTLCGKFIICQIPEDFIISDFERILKDHPSFQIFWLSSSSAMVAYYNESINIEHIKQALTKEVKITNTYCN